MKKTRNEILLEKLKEKYPELDISKPVYPDGYWDCLRKNIIFNESNNTSKKTDK